MCKIFINTPEAWLRESGRRAAWIVSGPSWNEASLLHHSLFVVMRYPKRNLWPCARIVEEVRYKEVLKSSKWPGCFSKVMCQWILAIVYLSSRGVASTCSILARLNPIC